MDRTIKVTGKGKVSAKLDLIRINISIKEINKEYSKTLEMVSKSTKSLKETIIRAGLDIKNLKTLSFNISSQYESYYDKDNIYRSKFIGYCYKEKLYINFQMTIKFFLGSFMNYLDVKLKLSFLSFIQLKM